MRTKIFKTTLIVVIATLVSYPVVAAKPPTTQSLLSGPIPVNSASTTETFSCNVINQALFTPLVTSTSLCGMTEAGGVTCMAATQDKIETGRSIQVDLVNAPFKNAATVFCMIHYEGKAGEITGTACLSDYVNGAQTCLPLEPGQYQGIKIVPLP
jgi:hypothetical protein